MANEQAKAKGGAADGGAMGFAIAIVLIALLGVGAGYIMAPRNEATSPPKHDEKSPAAARDGKAAGAHGSGHGGDGKRADHASEGVQDHVIPLDPVLVSAPGLEGRWVRIEGAIAFTTPPKDDRALLLKQIVEDMLAYLRTLTLAQIGSSSGLEFLRDDLSEIARIRSKGRARAFILRTMVVE